MKKTFMGKAMKMKKNIVIVGVLLLVVALAGCVAAKDVTSGENAQLNKGKSDNINVRKSDDDYVTIGEIIEFEKDGVHVLTGDIAEIFRVHKENLQGFYLGETVGVKEVGDNKFELETYKHNDFTIRHTSMGNIISTVSGKIKEVNHKKLVINTKDGDMEFEAHSELFFEKETEVTVDYIEFKSGAEKIVLDIYDETSKINLTVKNISRAKNGTMVLNTEDDKVIKYEVYVLGKSVLNFNHSDLKANDKIIVYPDVIRESYPAQIDAKMIKKP